MHRLNWGVGCGGGCGTIDADYQRLVGEKVAGAGSSEIDGIGVDAIAGNQPARRTPGCR